MDGVFLLGRLVRNWVVCYDPLLLHLLAIWVVGIVCRLNLIVRFVVFVCKQMHSVIAMVARG